MATVHDAYAAALAQIADSVLIAIAHQREQHFDTLGDECVGNSFTNLHPFLTSRRQRLYEGKCELSNM